MRAICSFCKTEFFAAKSGRGKCPVCGHRNFAAARGKAGRGTLKFFIAAMLFLLASIFAIVSLDVFDKRQRDELLTVSISDIRHTDAGYVVRGNIRNFSERTYSIPDLVFAIKTNAGIFLGEVRHLPPNALIEPASDMEFVRRIGPKVPGAGKISVRFAEEN